MSGKLEVRITKAHEAADGFGTATLEHLGSGYRRVGIRPEHLRWQVQRYKSMRSAPMTEEQWDRLKARLLRVA